MNNPDYVAIIKGMRPSKRFGQNFLVSRSIAKSEANFGIDRTVLELGPGLGMLTRELCKLASRVVAVERDKDLYEYLDGNLKEENLMLINSDFFKVSGSKLKADIMISNIPYNLSSKTIAWLGARQMPGVLCLQKEFVNHMAAKPSSKNYSRLSVFSSLQFSVTVVMDVPASSFYPEPGVTSSIVYLRPKKIKISKRDYEILSQFMIHKKKTVRNALADSRKALGIEKELALRIAESMPNKDKRPFQLSPEDLLEISRYVSKQLQ